MAQPLIDIIRSEGLVVENSYIIKLKDEADKEKLRALIREADVVVDGYRPGVMERNGFSREAIFELVKDRGRGIIHVSVPQPLSKFADKVKGSRELLRLAWTLEPSKWMAADFRCSKFRHLSSKYND